MAWNPLDDGFLTSTVLKLGPTPVAIWTMLMASADKHGNSKLTPVAAASLLRIGEPEARAAFKALGSPDEDSRNKDDDGRRIVLNTDGTWHLVSHQKYRRMASKAAAVQRTLDWRERRREKAKTEKKAKKPETAIVKAESWSSQACDDWNERFGAGTAPGNKIGNALKRIVDKHGWDVIRPAWRHYLREKDPEFLNPADFATKLTRWLQGKQAKNAIDRWLEREERDGES